MTAKENIENLYKTFNKYQLNGKIEKCPCGCISDEDEQKIYSKSLQELTADDLGFYNGKAMTTWGNEENYKHFLPRIIEIYKEDKINGWIDLDTIHNKLKHANWEDWNLEEQIRIKEFVEIDWKELVNHSKNEIRIEDFESYLNYFEIEELIKMWEFPQNKIALNNFVEFFYMNGNEILYSGKKVKLNGKDRKHEFVELLERDNLTESLENEFFNSEMGNKEYAGKVSTVLQMIENEIKNKNGR
ncbi:MAG: hypothetical protein R2788_26465 [Saprospiraceae bacterium]